MNLAKLEEAGPVFPTGNGHGNLERDNTGDIISRIQEVLGMIIAIVNNTNNKKCF